MEPLITDCFMCLCLLERILERQIKAIYPALIYNQAHFREYLMSRDLVRTSD